MLARALEAILWLQPEEVPEGSKFVKKGGQWARECDQLILALRK